MKILTFGSCNFDYVYSVSHFVNPGETLNANGREKHMGGKGLNQSVAIAKSGTNVYHAGCIGKDGEELRAILEQNGVDTSFLKTVDIPTGHAVIQVNNDGQNCIIIYSGANNCVTKDVCDRVLSNFDSDTLLLLQNEISNIDYIIDCANRKGMKIVLNPSPFEKSLRELDLNKLYMLIVNEIEAYEFCGERTPEKIQKWFGERYHNLKVVLTLGQDGSVYFDTSDNELLFQSAYVVDVRDTTCAGDTFTGYFLSNVAQGQSIKNSLKIASCASALAVSKNGAATSIPRLCDVQTALKELKQNIGVTMSDREILEKICGYVKDNLSVASLQQLSMVLGYSASHTAAKVKMLTGMCFTDYLQKERCAKAAQLLTQTQLDIESIVELSGYKNGSFFRRIFKEMYGKSPLKYRNDFKNGG